MEIRSNPHEHNVEREQGNSDEKLRKYITVYSPAAARGAAAVTLQYQVMRTLGLLLLVPGAFRRQMSDFAGQRRCEIEIIERTLKILRCSWYS